jgi:sodium-dependent dicarboxylate transporter 2/3/5
MKSSLIFPGQDWVDRIKWIGMVSGPLLFTLILWFAHPANMNPQAVQVMAVTVWIAIWWITEAVPLPVTSLLPIILFPLMHVMKLEDTTRAYGHPLIFLYIGGFLLAIAIEKTGLHSRIAINIIRSMGTKLSMIVLGFMLSTGFLSMWISNTATALMMLPIGLAIVSVTASEQDEYFIRFRKSLMLAIAYAASIGGVATLIGTPPNLVFAGVVRDMYNREVTFSEWFMYAFPLAVVLLFFAWWYITRFAFPLHDKRIAEDKQELAFSSTRLGKMSSNEKKVAILFFIMALCWITRSFILVKWIPGLDDTIIGMAGGLLLFLIPDQPKSLKGILNWEDAGKLPWGIILLFGGGLALADAFESSGLAKWIGESMTGLTALSTVLIIFVVVAIVNFLTEFTSNLATVTMILPLLAPIAISSGIEPIVLMMAATMAASCGFMMPAGTPPNAIAFGTGHLRIWDMIRTGFVLNVVSIILITCLMYFVRL